MDLNGGMQVRVPGNRYKYHRLRHNKILDSYDDFNNYVVIGSSRATMNFGCSDVQHHVMTSKYSIVISRIYHNNKNTIVLSTLFVSYLSEFYEQLSSRIKQLQ